jgi:S1-C subfamily serine protease
MLKEIRSVLLSTVTLLALASSAYAFDAKLEAEVFEPSVKLVSDDGMCSGTVIYSDRAKVSGDASTYVLTAKHCVTKVGQTFEVQKAEYDKGLNQTRTVSYPAVALGTSFLSDLALLKLDDKTHVWPNVAKWAPEGTTLEYNEPVLITAYPAGASMTTTYGNLGYVEKVPQLADVSQSTRFQRATPDIAPGSSGGAIFVKNEAGDYLLIGTTTAGLRGFSFINMFTPLDEVQAYLKVATQMFGAEK